MQKAIQKLMDDGTYKKILDTWGVSSGAVDKAEINPSVGVVSVTMKTPVAPAAESFSMYAL